MKVTKAALAKANQPVLPTMLVSEARVIEAAQCSVARKFERAALAHIKETEGLDLVAEIPNWTSFAVKAPHTPRGHVEVKQYLHDERAPRMLTNAWIINKNVLVK